MKSMLSARIVFALTFEGASGEVMGIVYSEECFMEKIKSLFCGKAFTPFVCLKDVRIDIEDEVISSISDSSSCDANSRDFSELNIAPGFVDVHIQGCGGADFLNADPDAVRTIRKTALMGGCTSLLATTTFDKESGAFERLKKLISAIEEGEKDPQGARIVGIHLEGPYLNPEKRGGFGLRYFRNPGMEDFQRILDIVGNRLKMITISPELPGAFDVIREAVARGIIVSLGHSVADRDTTVDAFNAGSDHVTHLFNAMSGIHHRNPGMAGAALSDERVFVQVIPDGVHLHPDILRLIYKIKGPSGTCLITDATAPCGLPDGTQMQGVGGTISVKDGGVRLPDGTLAGSALMMDEAVRRMKDLAGISIRESLVMSSLTPARSIRMEETIGSINPGSLADFILFDDDLKIHYLVTGGKLIPAE